ncbi:hypothetical protein U6Y26_11600, partial [Brucella melitensis]
RFDTFRSKIHRVPSGYGKKPPSWRRQTSMGNHPTFGFAPKAEDFLSIPNHKLTRHYSLATLLSNFCLYVNKRRAGNVFRRGLSGFWDD